MGLAFKAGQLAVKTAIIVFAVLGIGIGAAKILNTETWNTASFKQRAGYWRDTILRVPPGGPVLEQFSFGHRAFDPKVPLDRSREMSLEELVTSIHKSLPRKLRKQFPLIMDRTLHFSAKYKVDPFWVLSVMWTESHFNPKAVSPKEARGLMQIMPATGEYLHKKLKRPITAHEVVDVISDPETNIELGVFYLSRLLRMFHGNFKYATVAYNMGPYWVRNELRAGRVPGKNNQYYEKVKVAYKILSTNYVSHMKKSIEPYKLTTIYLNPKRPKVNVVADIMRMLKSQNTKTEIALINDDNPFAYSLIL